MMSDHLILNILNRNLANTLVQAIANSNPLLLRSLLPYCQEKGHLGLWKATYPHALSSLPDQRRTALALVIANTPYNNSDTTLEMANLLLGCGAKPNSIEDQKIQHTDTDTQAHGDMPPLTAALGQPIPMQQKYALCSMLLKAGANPNKIKKTGNNKQYGLTLSPFHWAITAGHIELADLFLQHGACCHKRTTDPSKLLPEDLAWRFGHLSLSEYLEAIREGYEPQPTLRAAA